MTRTEAIGNVIRWFDSPGVSRLMRLIAFVSLLIALLVGVRQYELASCLANWQDQSTRVSSQRATANDSDRKALDDMVQAIATAKTKDDVAKALSTYLQARAFADGQRSANPLPAPPSAVC